jgi:hypothetical protein
MALHQHHQLEKIEHLIYLGIHQLQTQHLMMKILLTSQYPL